MRVILACLLLGLGLAAPAVWRPRLPVAAGLADRPLFFWDPFVYAEGGRFHWFFGSLFCRRGSRYELMWNPADPQACRLEDAIFALGYGLEAGDGKWRFRRTPLFYPAPAGAWDDHYLETPSLLQAAGRFLLFYSAWPKTRYKRYQIGVATLPAAAGLAERLLDEGLHFTRWSDKPLIPSGAGIGRENTQEPSVVRRGQRLEVFYLGLQAERRDGSRLRETDPLAEAQAAVRRIALGRRCFSLSLRPLDCGPQPAALLETRFTPKGLAGDMINTPEVVWSGRDYLLFYTDLASGRGPYFQANRIAYRRSADAVHWSEPVMLVGPEPGESDWGTASPTAALLGMSAGHLDLMFGFTGWGRYAPVQAQPGACFQGRFRTPLDPGHQACVTSSLMRGRLSLPP